MYDKGAESASSSKPYAIEMTASAEAVYKEMAKKAGEAELRRDESDPHYRAFAAVRDAIQNTISRAPGDKRHALAGDISSLYRIKTGKISIGWLTSAEHRRIIILFISESSRRNGDIKDPYSFFAGMVMSGRINAVFEKLGIRGPSGRTAPEDKLKKQ